MLSRTTVHADVRSRRGLSLSVRRVAAWVSFATVALLSASLAAAQSGGAPPVQSAGSNAQQIQAYLSGIVDEKQYVSRWTSADQSGGDIRNVLCFELTGLDEPTRQAMLRRLSMVASQAGALVGTKVECHGDYHFRHTNFLVMFTPDPRKTLQDIWKNDRLQIALTGDCESYFARGVVDRLLANDQAVRVWYDRRRDCTRIDAATVIVDDNRIKDLSTGQIADYIAMVGLVTLREKPVPGDSPTIMNLFTSGVSHPKGLTTWDMAFLQDVYDSTPVNLQRRWMQGHHPRLRHLEGLQNVVASAK